MTWWLPRKPRRMRVTGVFNVRGGITTTVVATHPNPGTSRSG